MSCIYNGIYFYFLSFQLHIHFNEAAISTYEYPSEQSLLEEMAPEPGDFDYHDPSAPAANVNAVSSPTEEIAPVAGGSLRSTPGINSGSGTVGKKEKHMN